MSDFPHYQILQSKINQLNGLQIMWDTIPPQINSFTWAALQTNKFYNNFSKRPWKQSHGYTLHSNGSWKQSHGYTLHSNGSEKVFLPLLNYYRNPKHFCLLSHGLVNFTCLYPEKLWKNCLIWRVSSCLKQLSSLLDFCQDNVFSKNEFCLLQCIKSILPNSCTCYYTR